MCSATNRRLPSERAVFKAITGAPTQPESQAIRTHMKFFADARIKRNTALVVLLVWLFALASGVANACLLETHDPHSRAAKEPAASTGHAPAQLLAQWSADADRHDGSDGTRESCLKVCDDGMRTLPKAYSGVDHTDPGPAPLVATLWTAAPDVVSTLRRLDALAIPIVGPPFRVRYSRLAL